MNENARDELRNGLNILWEGIRKRKELCNTPEGMKLIEKVEAGLNRAEKLYAAGVIQQAMEVAIQMADFLDTLNIRCAIALFRKANAIQKEHFGQGNTIRIEVGKFFTRTVNLLDRAETFLDEGKIQEAHTIIDQYFTEKVRAGLTGPVAM